MRVLVTGSRFYTDQLTLYTTLDQYHTKHTFTVLIHGGAKGVDTLAGLWGYRHNIEVRPFMANWKQYGRSAGAMRNQKMIDVAKPELVIAFPLINSIGTIDMIHKAKAANIPTIIIGDENVIARTKESRSGQDRQQS